MAPRTSAGPRRSSSTAPASLLCTTPGTSAFSATWPPSGAGGLDGFPGTGDVPAVHHGDPVTAEQPVRLGRGQPATPGQAPEEGFDQRPGVVRPGSANSGMVLAGRDRHALYRAARPSAPAAPSG